MKELWQSLNKFYFFNFSLFGFLLFSIFLTFLIQFKVEALQDEILQAENDISTFEDQIQMLEVEWVYLTRPERLRNLASRYLKDSGYVLASQIKSEEQLEYFASLKKVEEKEVQKQNLDL